MKPFASIAFLALMTGCLTSSSSSADKDGNSNTANNTSEPGCGDNLCDSDENMNTCPADCEIVVGDQVDMADCTGGLSQLTINSNLLIVNNLDQSYHEMVVCGGLYYDIVVAIASVVIDLLEGASNVKMPDGYTTDGQGTYTAQASGFTNVRMDVQFFYGEDYEVGAKGDLIPYNLFDPDTYLVNPSVDLDVWNGKAKIHYASKGPLVELLGRGANPSNPIRLDIDDIANFDGDMGKQQVAQTMVVVDEVDTTTVSYTVDSPLQTVSAALSSGLINFNILDASAEDSVKPQSLVIDDWNVGYSDNGGLDGDIDFTVTGGDFDFLGTFTYDDAAYAEISLTCAP